MSGGNARELSRKKKRNDEEARRHMFLDCVDSVGAVVDNETKKSPALLVFFLLLSTPLIHNPSLQVSASAKIRGQSRPFKSLATFFSPPRKPSRASRRSSDDMEKQMGPCRSTTTKKVRFFVLRQIKELSERFLSL